MTAICAQALRAAWDERAPCGMRLLQVYWLIAKIDKEEFAYYFLHYTDLEGERKLFPEATRYLQLVAAYAQRTLGSGCNLLHYIHDLRKWLATPRCRQLIEAIPDYTFIGPKDWPWNPSAPMPADPPTATGSNSLAGRVGDRPGGAF